MTAPAGCCHGIVVRRGNEFFCATCGNPVRIRKGPKYRNEKAAVDNIVFDSRREARRYVDLKLMERAGRIRKLKLQPRFDFKIGGVLMFSYYADFKYIEVIGPGEVRKVVEDAKGCRTPTYRLKKKIIEAHYKIRIIEI